MSRILTKPLFVRSHVAAAAVAAAAALHLSISLIHVRARAKKRVDWRPRGIEKERALVSPLMWEKREGGVPLLHTRPSGGVLGSN